MQLYFQVFGQVPRGGASLGTADLVPRRFSGSSLWLSLFPASPFTYPLPKIKVLAPTGWAVSQGLHQGLFILGIFFSSPFY